MDAFLRENDLAKEIGIIRNFKYDGLCDYLKKKYGEVPEPYFINENCRTKNSNIKRSSEGLFIHHIFESRVVMLSHPEYAIQFPYAWQEGKNLVYCNYFEHILLHLAIVKEFLKTEAKKTRMAVGIGGLLNFMIPEIIDYINGYQYARDYMRKALQVIDGNELLFIDILEDLKGLVMCDYELFAIVFDVCGRSKERIISVFKEGKMIKEGAFNDYLFKYSIVKKEIRLMSSANFSKMIARTLSYFGYDYVFDIRTHGDYSYVGFYYKNRCKELVSKEFAIYSEELVDIETIRKTMFREIVLPDTSKCLIKKSSVLSYERDNTGKKTKKRFFLTIDGVMIGRKLFSEEQVISVLSKNH